jgi:hypothetical protein
MAEVLTLKKFLTANDILNTLYPGTVTLVAPPGANRILLPQGPMQVVYGFGTVAYGVPIPLQIGYPNALTYWGSLNIGTDQTASQVSIFNGTNGNLGALPHALSLLVNQPLIASNYDASATYGPIAATSIAAAGSGYAAHDTFTLSAGGGDATGEVLTVSAMTGHVLTYTITDPGTAYSAAAADQPSETTTDSEAGTGLTLNVTSVLQGNGQLYIEFDYSIVTVPYPVR